MNRDIWGPPLWLSLHTITFTYAKNRLHATKREKGNMLQFLNSLQFVLPCASCKRNYATYILQNPPRLNNRRELFEWMVDLHNSVNLQNGKRIYTYLQVESMYKKIYKN